MIKIYRDDNALSVFLEDANGTQFLNSLQAVLNSDSTISIVDLAKAIEIVSNSSYTEFVDQNDQPYGNDAPTTVNALNSQLSISGTPTDNPPNITSATQINLVEGQTLNYELTADYGVGYEWDLSNVAGVTTVEGNIRKLVGGSALTAGTYDIPVKAINYNGEDSETIVLTVSTPPFANTKSVRFNQNDWLGANAALLDGILGRTGNGSGSTDAWSISFYFKSSNTGNQEQTIFYFGANDVANGNHIRIKWNGSNTARQQLVFQYGSTNNNLILKTPVGSVSNNDGWQHFLITYDGGTTGSSSGSISDYYSRFKIFIDGVQQTTINSNSNYGITSALSGQNLRVGRYNSSGYMRSGCLVDELAIFDSDQSANISDIYNGGTPFDLSTLNQPANVWWRMGDGDNFPLLVDSGDDGLFCTMVMTNMTAADIVSDVPL